MRPTTRTQLYNLVERSVLGERREEVARAHLAALSAIFEPIWHAYKNPTVTVDYGTPGAVHAYRLHYLPHYAYTAYQALAAAPLAVFERIRTAGLDLTAVAAGPFPEIIGLIEVAASRAVTDGRIVASVFDVAIDTWRPAAEESIAIARRLVPGITVEPRFHPFDLRRRPPAALPDSDVVIFQNCINEVCHDGRPTASALALANTLRAGGALVISELNQYPRSVQAIQALEAQLLSLNFVPLARFDATHSEETPFVKVPPETFWNFYRFVKTPSGAWEKAFPPKKNLNFSWSVWSR